MKQTWNSFLQTVFQSIKMLSASAPAKRRRDTAVLTAGILLVTAITFAAGSFPETGNGAMVAFAETPGETGGQEEGTYDGNTDEEKRDPESIMAAEEAADTENGTETRKEEAENGAETPEGGGAGEEDTTDQETETAAESSDGQEEAAAGEDSGAPEGEAAESTEASERAAVREGSGGQEGTASGESAELAEGAAAQEASGMRRSGGGLEAGPIPLHRPFSQVGGLGMDPDSRRPEPDWAREAESSSGPSIRQMDQAFRRDSRRYDGGFFLY